MLLSGCCQVIVFVEYDCWKTKEKRVASRQSQVSNPFSLYYPSSLVCLVAFNNTRNKLAITANKLMNKNCILLFTINVQCTLANDLIKMQYNIMPW